jgi:F-type H+-transporting ATPase subunit a
MMMQGQDIDIAEMIFHHTGDSHEIEFDLVRHVYTIHLPEWKPIQIGSVSIDLSPTKYTVFVVLAALIVYVLMKTTAIGVARAQKAGKAPGGYAGAMEAMVLFVRNDIAIDNIGHEMGPLYAPLIMSFFFFILVCNLLGLFPWGGSPTGNLAVTMALALIAFIAIEIGGMIKLGFKGYMGTIFPHVEGLPKAASIGMSIFLAPIEILSKFVKPFALTVRLFGNMTAGHFVILALFGIVFTFGHFGILSYGIGGITVLVVLGVMLLEILVAFLQAYVFALLAAVFIGLMQHEH